MIKGSVVRKKILDKNEINIISKYILDNENKIKKLGEDTYQGTSDNSLTGRYKLYNLFNSDIGPILRKKILPFLEENNIKKPAWIKCWANTFRKGEGIDKHKHGDFDYICGNVFISGNTLTGTNYYLNNNKLNMPNKPGEVHLFDSNTVHGVDKNMYDDIRISIAFDVIMKETKNFFKWE
jgi:hypothetical protein|tara:strand:- start:78 stop:617 length:540 start_codon:yes stop_codon:yes gene_type:complete